MKAAGLFLILLLFMASLSASAHQPAQIDGSVSLDAAAFRDLDGVPHAVREVKTDRLAIVFWAFWCDTWKKAMPYLAELNEKMPELNCTLWAVSLDGRYTDEVRRFLEKKRIPFQLLVDDGTWRARLKLRKTPTILVLDQSRRILWSCEGYPGNIDLEKAIRSCR